MLSEMLICEICGKQFVTEDTCIGNSCRILVNIDGFYYEMYVCRICKELVAKTVTQRLPGGHWHWRHSQ